MRFKPTCGAATADGRAGFTLAEVLAALVFMAIVIPVAVQGIRVANRAGVVAERKAEAARVADRLLNEIVVTDQAQSAQSGTVLEGSREYRWRMRNENWEKDALRLLTMQVVFTVQGDEYDVQMSTLWDSSAESSASSTTSSSESTR